MPDSVQGRMRAVEELVPLLAQIPQQDRRQLTLVALADQLKVSPEVLLRKLPESLHSENENAKPIHSAHTESSRTDEWWVVQALLAQGQLWSLARQYLLPEEMQDTRLRHIYSRLMQLPPDLLHPLDPSGVERQDPELHRDLAPLLAEDFLERNLESQFRWSVRRLKERSLKLRYQEKSAGLVEEDRLRAGMELRRLNAQLQQLLPQAETMQAP
jgi:DNA primase